MLRNLYFHPNGQIPPTSGTQRREPAGARLGHALVVQVRAAARPGGPSLLERSSGPDDEFQLVGEPEGPLRKNVFAGGFLGLDNIGVFDRSAELPTGGSLEQADGTAWMAFYSQCMAEMA